MIQCCPPGMTITKNSNIDPGLCSKPVTPPQVCVSVIPTIVITPPPVLTPPPNCPQRPQGDANCDNTVNEADFDIWNAMMKGQSVCTNCSADFNGDGKISVVDFEIWRSTVYN